MFNFEFVICSLSKYSKIALDNDIYINILRYTHKNFMNIKKQNCLYQIDQVIKKFTFIEVTRR